MPREAPGRRVVRPDRAAVVVGGPGLDNARRSAERLVTGQCVSALISSGYAGALVSGLKIGDVVVDTSVPHWRELAAQRAVVGRIATVDRMIGSAAERAWLAAQTAAIAVDMESAAVAEVAREHGLPFASVRAITDTPGHDLVLDWDACRRGDGTFSTPKLLAQALHSRRGIAEIVQLWYASRLASYRLGLFLGEMLGLDGTLAQ